MICTPPDPFDEWMALEVPPCDDPVVDVVRARPDEFDRIYDCVDEAFGRARSRELYDWLYRRNPYGLARVWYVRERSTGRILKTGASLPWPIWRDDRPLLGVLAGDAATVPDWQRRGLSAIRRTMVRSHPWHGTVVSIAEPNQGSRIVSTKAGDGDMILGRLRGGVAVLRAGPVLERAGLPGWLATGVGAAASPVLRTWQRFGARVRSDLRFEPIDRFTTDLDDVTVRTMHFPLYWCPHNADFLNWRYLDHPTESYAGFALVDDDRPVAYSVLRIGGYDATISEFAASPQHASTLMAHTLGVARAAGCPRVNFFAPPSWRHWTAFRRAGFLPYTTTHHLLGIDWHDRETSDRLESWQVTPGDRDYH